MFRRHTAPGGSIASRRLHTAVLAVLVVACGRAEPAAPTIETETFVEVMVSLRRASIDLPGQDAFIERRDEILRDAGVTDSALVAFVRVHGSDPARMAVIWDSVAARVRAAGDAGPDAAVQ